MTPANLLRDIASRYDIAPRIDSHDLGAELTLPLRTDEGKPSVIPDMLATEIVSEGYEAMLVDYGNGVVDVCMYERIPDSFLDELGTGVRVYLQPEREAEFLRRLGEERAGEVMAVDAPTEVVPELTGDRQELRDVYGSPEAMEEMANSSFAREMIPAGGEGALTLLRSEAQRWRQERQGAA